MKIYTYSEARRKLADLLDQVSREGPVQIKRRDGREYVIRLASTEGSPADIEGVDTDFTAEEIVDFLREGRERERR